ncbi:uncharacterized protein LOC141601348 [Silene latifolia]|uniref:uncharacterized protein LOC141601348 n=1 Tax=Silene latifolia TaxID=37657 RepID=UPI003D76AA86
MSSDSARPKVTLQMILAQRRKRATGGAPKPASKRKNESSLDAEAACSKKPATSSDSVPVEVTPLASLPPEDREVSTPKGPNAPLPEMNLKLPEGFGRSRALGHWPYLERLLLPGPRSSLEKRPLKEMADLEAEHAFESLQISLLIREKLAKLEDEVCLLQTEKRELLDQLDEERKVLKEKKANLSKALTDAAACSSWEMKIACIGEFREGKLCLGIRRRKNVCLRCLALLLISGSKDVDDRYGGDCTALNVAPGRLGRRPPRSVPGDLLDVEGLEPEF